ncbi:hypothetical protein C2S52_023567 [Perilla frutescens var. hirtella]|nr:hypothetical protein C2S52_023567 [Perilla frutescens var. hirtella]
MQDHGKIEDRIRSTLQIESPQSDKKRERTKQNRERCWSRDGGATRAAHSRQTARPECSLAPFGATRPVQRAARPVHSSNASGHRHRGTKSQLRDATRARRRRREVAPRALNS